MGDAIPGTDFVRDLAYGRDVGEAFLRASTDVGGAGLAIPIEAMKFLFDKNPDQWKRFERILPTVGKRISQTARWARDGEAQDNQGNRIIDFDFEDPSHLMELAFNAFAFTPERLSNAQDRSWARYESEKFYSTMRSGLLAYHSRGVVTGNKEMQEKGMAKIRKFNATVPYKALTISNDTIQNSWKATQRTGTYRELGLSVQKGNWELDLEINELYEEEPPVKVEEIKGIKFLPSE